MKEFIKEVLVLALMFAMLVVAAFALAPPAQAGSSVPCSGGTKHIVRCVLHDIHGGVPGGWNRVDQVVQCESGWNPRAGGAHALYAGLFQEEKGEHKNWSIPGADTWMRQWLDDHHSARSAKGRLDPLAASIVTLSHVAGPDGWSYLGDCG